MQGESWVHLGRVASLSLMHKFIQLLMFSLGGGLTLFRLTLTNQERVMYLSLLTSFPLNMAAVVPRFSLAMSLEKSSSVSYFHSVVDSGV